jgi:N-acetylmuramoyl-L-alanine amidase
MREIKLIVIHCSASPNDRTLFTGKAGKPGFRTPAEEIDAWHKARAFTRSSYWRGRQNAHLTSIGYHFLIARNGAVFTGRHEDEVGAHATGWNSQSIGICMVGTDQFTAEQWAALRSSVDGIAGKYKVPIAPPVLKVVERKGFVVTAGICGHRDLPGVAKECPGFDVTKWIKDRP